MRWVNWVSKNSLPRMERVGACGRRQLAWRDARNQFWLGCANLELRKIFDLSGPGELGVCERGICFWPGDLRQRHGNKCDVPERCRENCPARETAFDPDIFEKTCREKIPGEPGAAEQFREIAGDALVELSPAEFELRLVRTV